MVEVDVYLYEGAVPKEDVILRAVPPPPPPPVRYQYSDGLVTVRVG